jgi:hypothetical protein
MNDAGDIDHVASAIFSVSKSYPSAGDMPATLRSEKVEFSISLKPETMKEKLYYQNKSLSNIDLI